MIGEESITAYPLTWPSGWTRAKARTRAAFGRNDSRQENGHETLYFRSLNVGEATRRVLAELRRMGVPRCIVSTNVPVRNDGMPYAGATIRGNDPGASVYWKDPRTGDRRCMAIDMYDRVADNLAAIAATLDAMRAIKRHGGAQILERAFLGFKALPAPEQWFQILQLDGEDVTEDQIEAAYLALAKIHHPDVGGQDWQMARINDARDRGLAHVRARY